MDQDEPLTPTERADAVAARILANLAELDQEKLSALLREEFRAVANEERRACADEIGRHNSYQGRGSHFAEILRRRLPGRR
jgi:hypothetical protein